MLYSKKSFAGPWLLSDAALAELDAILDATARRAEPLFQDRAVARENRRMLRELRERLTPDEIERSEKVAEPSDRGDEPESDRLAWDVKIKLKGSIVVQAHSFAECATQLRGTSELPVAFDARLGGYSRGLSFGIHDRLDPTLDIESQVSGPMSGEFLAVMSEWAMKYQQPALVRFWGGFGAIGVLMAGFVMLVGVALVNSGGQSAAASQAASLLVGGISDKEVPAAIDLLLRRSYDLENIRSGSYAANVATLALVALTALLTFVRPKNVLELNTAARKSVRFYVAWIRFWTWGAPVWIALTFLSLAIRQWVWPGLIGGR